MVKDINTQIDIEIDHVINDEEEENQENQEIIEETTLKKKDLKKHKSTDKSSKLNVHNKNNRNKNNKNNNSSTKTSEVRHLFLMDEIFTPAEADILKKSTHRRTSTKCYRCRMKRISCSYEFPKCENCKNANVECHAWVKGLNKPIPRSLPLFLEDKVAQLEIELEQLKKHHVIDNAEEESYSITKYVSTPFLESFNNIDSNNNNNNNNNNTIATYSFFYFKSSSLPAPFDTMIDYNKRGHLKSFIDKHPPVDLKSIPKDVVKIMMSNYTDFHLPQYPIISKPVLLEITNRILDDFDSATTFDKAVISITMAISAALISNRSEKRALSSSSALFATTISLIIDSGFNSNMDKLQITLLIAHYAFANPYAADIWNNLRDALRLCIDMGIHREIESEVITVVDVDDRRRLFLVCSGMLRHLSSVLRIKFPIPQPLISVEYPTIVDDSFITENGIDYSGPQTKAAALHFYMFRLCETEVCDVLWHNKEIQGSIDDWVTNMERKVENWYLKAEEFAKINQLRFRLISKASLQIRLRRRTPRIPKPSQSSFVKLINAVSIHVDEYLRDAQSSQVSYLLMGVYYIQEAAINLLDVMWFESDWILEYFSSEYLDSKLKGCIKLLELFSERWPDISASNMPGYLEDLRLKVIDKLNNNQQINIEQNLKISSQIEYLIFPHHTNSSTTSPPFAMVTNANNDNSLNIVDANSTGEYDAETILKEFELSDKSNWEDHFIDNNFWKLENLINQMGDYI
ncbi:hypothetical protein C6P40_001455 [Pichia californica]|uniref:Zn(2)-C6 fungal-type domain-containing protein n=1 Tax=Pichia californica TaxID=460514 RepID=A0A9P6WL23_9ASCO|nr:hypothetical protein C6P42_000299 [[Candida] californica]KAG0688057.1 hypothetical protein C6P40_001455 [[Candida] californica]